jgi:hypothetical protein
MHTGMFIPEDGASRHNARRKVFAALGARRVPVAHLRIAATAGARALVLAARRVLGTILDKDADGQLLGRANSDIEEILVRPNKIASVSD